MPELVDIKGVGPALAKAFAGLGYGTVEGIAAADPAGLAQAPGVGESRATALISAAQALLHAASSPDVPGPNEKEKSQKNADQKKKNKGGKKKRKKDKKAKKNKTKNNK
ncbi:MAG: helix-hairpin-helix domain-containing protein [Betaproteobacteria bacterium]|nr:MAG: helix-hairpin-helix domain-containing protein [Betaproteobacteria bacterium]